MIRSLKTLVLLCVFAISWCSNSVRAEDWNEPKDGIFTEKQVENYAAAQKDVMQLMKAVGKALEGSKSGVGALTLAAGMDEKVNAILAKHDLKKAEYEWLASKVSECMGVSMYDSMLDLGKADLVEQKKKNAMDLEAARQKLAQFEKARKAGTRVMTREQHDDAVKSAKDMQDSAREEVKQRGEEAKNASDEAAKFEADAKAADALAKNPPADVDKDAREDFIKGKKDEAESLRNSAKESRDKEKEARKAESESKSKVAAATKAMANPELPVTDDEKAQVNKDNEEGFANAKSEIETLMQASQLLADSDGQWKKQQAEAHKNIKEENLVLVKKHLKEVQDAWGIQDKK